MTAPRATRTTTRTVVGVLAVAVVGVALLCCQQILSIDGDISVQPTTVACGMPAPNGACPACVMSQCCDQATACAGDPGCLALEGCLLLCGTDYGCRAACGENNQIGNDPSVPIFETCLATSCSDACGMLCGTAGSYTTPDAAQACQNCINLRACATTLACASSLPCQAAGHCAYACATPDCRADCVDAGDAAALVNAAADLAECLGVCQFGNDWACVGRVGFQAALSPTQQATLTLVDPENGNKPLPGIVTLACLPNDSTCAMPFSSATSDADGTVVLPLPSFTLPSLGFQGHFDMTSPTQAIAPLEYFLAYPFSVPDAHLSLPVLTASYFQSLVASANVMPLATRGHVWLTAVDCLQLNAPNVTVTVDGVGDDEEYREVYVQDGLPSPTATETDGLGTVFFFNLPPGQLTFHVIPQDIGRVSSNVTVFVRPNYVSEVLALPTEMTK